MPFMVQPIRRFDDKFNSLNQKVDELEHKLAVKQKEAEEQNNNDWRNNIEPMIPMIGYMAPQQIQQNSNGLYGGLGMI